MENKLGQSIRKTNDLLQKNHVNSSYSSVRRTLKEDIKLKPWKLTRSQKLSPIQREARVISAKKLLKKFGLNPTRSNSKWKRLVNTDFSGRVSLLQKHNSKNNIIWSTSKTTIPLALQSVHQEKCSPGVLLYGAISSRGLIPPTASVFIDDWLKIECQKINKKKPTMDRFLYVKLVKQLKIHIDQLYGDVNVIWQDDGDSNHRSHYALAKINEISDNRINPEEQSDKMADIFLASVLRQKFSRHRQECLVLEKQQSHESSVQLCQQVEWIYILINTTNNNDSPVKIEMDITTHSGEHSSDSSSPSINLCERRETEQAKRM
ncbi:unnamed protein product [Rotaria sordida]|uniref:Uncharacterized protein n=1 Tax=Rotaria sordida TaxID=392033 RepID=A0A819H6K3_9BILA|nr:unnamed protein product [Rotaria sordida]CAF3892268.1 unnamed protein product [Rotaria sordida]CAF3962555.1 unnamed protein product [Rotaria sordida]